MVATRSKRSRAAVPYPGQFGENAVQEFVLLISYPSRGARTLADMPRPAQPVQDIFDLQGITTKDVKLTFGTYQMILTCEAPDCQAIGQAMRSISEIEGVRSEILLLLPQDQYLALLQAFGSNAPWRSSAPLLSTRPSSEDPRQTAEGHSA